MSMAPVAAAISGNSSGATKSKTQSIAWPGPAMKPSSDIDLFTTTLPGPVLVSLIVFLRRTLGCSRDPFRRLLARRSTATAASTEDTSPPATVNGPASPELTATVTATSATNGCQRRSATAQNARTVQPDLEYVRPEKRTVAQPGRNSKLSAGQYSAVPARSEACSW